MKKNYVRFMSSWSLYEGPEVSAWDPVEAMRVLKDCNNGGLSDIVPSFFRFTERVESPPVLVDGYELEVLPKIVRNSGHYFISGIIRRLDYIEARGESTDRILIDNMRINDWPIVVEAADGTFPFTEEDFIVDENGNIIFRGDEEGLVAYRTATRLARCAHRALG